MITQHRKGQGSGTIAVVFLFATGIMLMFFVIIMISQGGPFEQDTSIRVVQNTDEVRRSATVSSTMNDHMWKAESINQGKYDDKLAKEVISYYFSTSGDAVYFGESSVPKSEVREDIEAYLTYQLDQKLVESTDPYMYWLILEHGEQSIEVSNGDTSSQWRRLNFRIGLAGGEYAVGSILTEKSEGSSGGSDTGLGPGMRAP